MNRKEKLINSLTIAVNALKNDIVFYDWTHQDSCNAGVVSQAVLGVNQEELKKLRSPMFNILDGVNKRRKENSQNELEATWKNAVKNTCSITGKNLPKIIQDLEKAGLTREDIVHLEYLENPAILEQSGIEKNPVYKKVKTGEKESVRKIKSKGFFNWLFGRTELEKFTEPIYEEKIEGYAYPDQYYKKKENLIKYLSAWIRILKGETNFQNTRESLEAELLNAIAEERYERAAEIRNEIAVLT
jgi:hypothetical protein